MSMNEDNLKKLNFNGYVAYYMPEHPRAYKSNGCVYEHILVAEEMLGRPLHDEECVHHKDFDRTNNASDNLMVFATVADHSAFHGGAEAVLNSDGVYYCPSKKHKVGNLYRDACPICGKLKLASSDFCINCERKIRLMRIPKKEELENLISSMSYEAIGRKYGVAGNTVKKWCLKRNIKLDVKVRKANKESKDRLIELLNIHKSIGGVSKALGADHKTIKKWIDEYSISINRSNGFIAY